MGVAATDLCTGSRFHVHGPFIPTMERARPDFQVWPCPCGEAELPCVLANTISGLI